MIGGSKRLFQARRAIPADFEEPVGKLGRTFTLHPLQSFSDRFGNRLRHALSGKPRQLPGEFMGVLVFDVQAHSR